MGTTWRRQQIEHMFYTIGGIHTGREALQVVASMVKTTIAPIVCWKHYWSDGFVKKLSFTSLIQVVRLKYRHRQVSTRNQLAAYESNTQYPTDPLELPHIPPAARL